MRLVSEGTGLRTLYIRRKKKKSKISEKNFNFTFKQNKHRHIIIYNVYITNIVNI